MEFTNEGLIQDLVERTRRNIGRAEALQKRTEMELNKKQNSDAWSALECVEHLNRYSRFYLPELELKISKGNSVQSNAVFKSGVLGNYFAKSVSNKPKVNKMKTFREMNPNGSQLHASVLAIFIADQRTLLAILEKAKGIDLKRTKTAISISKLLKLRVGDTLRVVIYHNERHLAQAGRAVEV